eukprot:symbB.v1.2.005633.t1/scaffold309.1/size276354/14
MTSLLPGDQSSELEQQLEDMAMSQRAALWQACAKDSGETKLFKKPCQAGLCLKRKTGGYTSAEWDQHARDTITFSTEL